MTNQTMRGIPAVHRFLSDPRIRGFEPVLGKESLKRAIAGVLEAHRMLQRTPVPAFDDLAAEVLARLETQRREALVPVINATGILLHTNLGRAPLAAAALNAVHRIGEGYSNLEYDLEEGKRGSRYARATALLQSVTGAQDALVVNNCAAAVLLILDTFAKGREVIVARGQLIEIGGGFRLPDVLERSGATLVEAGATNRVYVRDFERALSPRTALLMRSHLSNYAVSGFTHDVDPKDLAALGRGAGVPVVEDLGSGALIDLGEYGLPRERTVQDAVADGIDLVAFSGDKVLGGPQAGIIVGSAPLIARMRNNPLIRALRVDKLTFAALCETLRLYLSPERRSEIPFLAMLCSTREELERRAREYCAAVPRCSAIESTAYAGGGTLPQSGFASVAVALPTRMGADAALARLRRNDPPIVARVEEGALLLDLRTILPEQDRAVVAALQSLES